MSHEVWATYSVKDHLDPRGLAADIMLFDRLVFPVPETAQLPPNSGSPVDIGPVEWRENADEWARWETERWDPAKQRRILDILRPVLRKVSWNRSAPQYNRYGTTAAELAAQQLPDYAFAATRTELTRDLPAYVTGVAAIGPAYRSIEAIERELSIRSADGRPQLPGTTLARVLAWKFCAPDPNDESLSDEELLQETVDFVDGNSAFRKRRAAFMKWQQEFLRGDTTDGESVARAVDEMRDLLEDATKAANQLTVRKIARYAFRLAPTGLSLALLAAGHPGGISAAVGSFFISVGGIAVDEVVFKRSEQGQPPPTAFVHDARRHFGWK